MAATIKCDTIQNASSATANLTLDTSGNATVGSSLKFPGSTSGTITVVAPATAGTNTATLPARTGNLMMDGPAFYVTQSTAQSISNNTTTNLANLTNVSYDTNSNFNTGTGSFTPTVSGYYQISGGVHYPTNNNPCFAWASVTKNGTLLNIGTQGANTLSTNGVAPSFSTLVYMNGTTDYINMVTFYSGGNQNTSGNSYTYFCGCLMRGA